MRRKVKPSCLKPLGSDTNDADNGDFDGVSYKFTWPGSISNPTAVALLNPQPVRFTSPTTASKNFTSMAFESDISRDESDDTAFNVNTACQRHIVNPADPNPGKGCVNPPPNSEFYPFYTTTQIGNSCWWQQGGPYLPGTTQKFGGSAAAEYGPLRAISYPANPTGTITKRFNDFRSNEIPLPCSVS